MPSARWEKLGILIRPQPDLAWMTTHAMLPTVVHVDADLFRVYFSGRDGSNRSLIGYAEIEIGEVPRVVGYSRTPVLSLGDLGCFDDNGVTPSWIIDHDGKRYLYYIGWNSGTTVRMHLFGGLALSDDGGETFTRHSRAPILERTAVDPFLNTAPCVLREPDGLWRMWYVSGIGWIHRDLPRYVIKYAESRDGMSWHRTGHVCIDFKSPDEHALARPCVVREDGRYRMWYGYKGKAYRIGYAESPDGKTWERLDDRAGIDVSVTGWDSEMIEYAYVFSHRGHQYMFYNGNDYGKEGAGLARLAD